MTRKDSLADLLDETAEILKPLTVSAPAGALMWNGKEYAPTDVEHVADPTATRWWGTLNTMAGLLRAQASPLSREQIEFIKQQLFGGMGSLGDVIFDERRTHGLPKDTNERLSAAVKKLWKSFITLDTWT